jgi:hypothetical protein
MKHSSAIGGGFGQMNPGSLSSRPDADTPVDEIHSSAPPPFRADERKEDEEMRRTGVIQSKRQVFEMAHEYFGSTEK